MITIGQQACDAAPFGKHEPLSLIAGTVCVYCEEFWRR